MQSKRQGWFRVQRTLNAEQGDIPGIRQRTDRQPKGAIIPAKWLDLCDDATYDFLSRSKAEAGLGAIVPYTPDATELEVLHLLYPAAFDTAPERGTKGDYPRKPWLKALRRFFVPEDVAQVSAGQEINVPRRGYQIVPSYLVACLSDDAYALAQSPRWNVFQTIHVGQELLGQLQSIWPEPDAQAEPQDAKRTIQKRKRGVSEPDPEPDTYDDDMSEDEAS